jgi:hypothetical protein
MPVAIVIVVTIVVTATVLPTVVVAVAPTIPAVVRIAVPVTVVVPLENEVIVAATRIRIADTDDGGVAILSARLLKESNAPPAAAVAQIDPTTSWQVAAPVGTPVPDSLQIAVHANVPPRDVYGRGIVHIAAPVQAAGVSGDCQRADAGKSRHKVSWSELHCAYSPR